MLKPGGRIGVLVIETSAGLSAEGVARAVDGVDIELLAELDRSPGVGVHRDDGMTLGEQCLGQIGSDRASPYDQDIQMSVPRVAVGALTGRAPVA